MQAAAVWSLHVAGLELIAWALGEAAGDETALEGGEDAADD